MEEIRYNLRLVGETDDPFVYNLCNGSHLCLVRIFRLGVTGQKHFVLLYLCGMVGVNIGNTGLVIKYAKAVITHSRNAIVTLQIHREQTNHWANDSTAARFSTHTQYNCSL